MESGQDEEGLHGEACVWKRLSFGRIRFRRAPDREAGRGVPTVGFRPDRVPRTDAEAVSGW